MTWPYDLVKSQYISCLPEWASEGKLFLCNLTFLRRIAKCLQPGSLREFDGADEFVVPHTYLIGVGTK